MADSIGLADFLYRIKQDVMQAEPDGAELPRLLMIEDVELEIQVGVSREASGGIDVQVVKLGLAELRSDPRWEQWSREIVEYTTRGASGSSSQRED